MNQHQAHARRRIDIYNNHREELEALPKRTAGRWLHCNYPREFASIEIGRDFIRYITGSRGRQIPKYTEMTIRQYKSTIAEGLAKLRAFTESKAQPIVLTDCAILVLSDIHLPFHDLPSLTAAIEYGESRQPDVVLLNGDILDCYDISRFMKEQDRPTITDEIAMGIEFLELLRKAFPQARIIYKLGNHEERMRHYILKNAPQFGNLKALDFESLLQFERLGIERVNREIIKAGKLNILHGHEMGESVFSPVNPARGYFLKAKANTLVGHYHQSSHHSEGDLNGNKVGVWSTGCLCSLTPEYRPFAYTKWKHGFAYVTVEGDGTFQVENKEIIDGRIF
jgi:predicted phosphodiesterase